MDIIGDLAEIGVNAINAQIDCMDLEQLSERFHGKMAFWGGFDRQQLLPFGSEEEVAAEVDRIASAFFQYGRTGIIALCVHDKDAKESNIKAYYDAWGRV
jgi:uroporphyrinogen decarboxylase